MRPILGDALDEGKLLLLFYRQPALQLFGLGVSECASTMIPGHRLSGIASHPVQSGARIEGHSHAQRTLPIAGFCGAFIKQTRRDDITRPKKLITASYQSRGVYGRSFLRSSRWAGLLRNSRYGRGLGALRHAF
jgi:hypothetical protein